MRPTLRSIAAVCVLLAGAGLMIEGRALWDWATGQPRGDELLIVAAASGDVAMARRALDDGASIEARSVLGCRALAFAAGGGERRFVSFLIAEGADVNAVDEHGMTALAFAAVEMCDAPTIRTLLEAGAHPDGESEADGPCPPLVSAASKGSLDSVAILLSFGAAPNLRGMGQNGYSPLEAALAANHPDIAALLCRYGAVR